ncbi:unnamed protein product [Arabidopsis halleri]
MHTYSFVNVEQQGSTLGRLCNPSCCSTKGMFLISWFSFSIFLLMIKSLFLFCPVWCKNTGGIGRWYYPFLAGP